MFKSILTSLSICLQGTVLEPKKKLKKRFQNVHIQPNLTSYNVRLPEALPYVLIYPDNQNKHDLLAKLHSCDRSLDEARSGAHRGRAHWCPDNHEQTYTLPGPPSPNPQIELYYKRLGLDRTKDPLLAGW